MTTKKTIYVNGKVTETARRFLTLPQIAQLGLPDGFNPNLNYTVTWRIPGTNHGAIMDSETLVGVSDGMVFNITVCGAA